MTHFLIISRMQILRIFAKHIIVFMLGLTIALWIAVAIVGFVLEIYAVAILGTVLFTAVYIECIYCISSRDGHD